MTPIFDKVAPIFTGVVSAAAGGAITIFQSEIPVPESATSLITLITTIGAGAGWLIKYVTDRAAQQKKLDREHDSQQRALDREQLEARNRRISENLDKIYDKLDENSRYLTILVERNTVKDASDA